MEDIFIGRGLRNDQKCAIVFKAKCDDRDSRPLVYDGRLIMPTDMEAEEYTPQSCMPARGWRR